MLVFPNCKINLGLYITEKRDDGFHNLNSVFYPVKLIDILEINESEDKKFSFTSYGLGIPGDENTNLCVKAYNLLSKDYDINPVGIHLYKNIPMGSGLGGGSSDATFTLKILNDIFKLNLSDDLLKHYTDKLGSDCSFFLKNKAVLASERGNVFEDIDLDLSGYHIIIVKPHVHISSADAFRNINPKENRLSLKEIIQSPIESWRNKLSNDFEKTVIAQHPIISSIKDKFYDLGAVYSSMSGSGSAIYGLFSEKINAKHHFSKHYYWQGILE